MSRTDKFGATHFVDLKQTAGYELLEGEGFTLGEYRSVLVVGEGLGVSLCGALYRFTVRTDRGFETPFRKGDGLQPGYEPLTTAEVWRLIANRERQKIGLKPL